MLYNMLDDIKLINMETLGILSIEFITPDVLQILTERPSSIEFFPGQAADISINKDKWKEEIRPFTFTSLPEDKFLQFTIKTYPERKGVTNELRGLKRKDELILHGVFGAISYKGEGVFIAGGAGVTPFISIFRHLKAVNAIGNNKLVFANKTADDIILRYEFDHLLGRNFINILSNDETSKLAHGYINEDFLRTHLTGSGKYVYLCGPPPMMDAVEAILKRLKIDESLIIKEAV
jgi:ferredoxin-NADP reductase